MAKGDKTVARILAKAERKKNRGQSRKMSSGDCWKDVSGVWWLMPPKGEPVALRPPDYTIEEVNGQITSVKEEIISYESNSVDGKKMKVAWKGSFANGQFVEAA